MVELSDYKFQKEELHTMSDEIIIAALTVFVSIITFIVTSVLQFIRDKMRNKQEKIMRVLEYQVDAYRQMYNSLLEYRDYFMLFVDSANEFKESEVPEKFSPLECNTKFRNNYNLNKLFFSKTLDDKIINILEHGEILNNLAISLCTSSDDFIECVEMHCKRIIVEIESCIKEIRKELGIK